MAVEAIIKAVELEPASAAEMDTYPLNIPALRGLRSLPLDPGVTLLVGENGSGKSTLVEAIAVAAGLNAEGGSANFNFATHPHTPELARHLRLVRGSRRPRGAFFLRAESFFNVVSEIERLDSEPGPGAMVIDGYGGSSLHQRSHGEAFLTLALHRFHGGGLYILDEPEAALSPQGCITLLLRIHQLVTERAQFIIATHSPILMAFPGATIHLLTEAGARQARYQDLDHVSLTRDFLANPDSFLRHLLDPP